MFWTLEDYVESVVLRHGYKLVGWPRGVPFKNLSDVPNLPKLEYLLAGFRNGTIAFRAITDDEYNAMAADPTPWIGADTSTNEDAEA